MFGNLRAIAGLGLGALVVASATAREWTDTTGQYKIEADLIGFDDEQVVLQRPDKQLGAFPIHQLSDADREFLKSKEAAGVHSDNIETMQTWTTKDGLKIVGRVVDYSKKEVKLQWRRGKAYVNNMVFANLPEIYQQMLPSIVSHLESIELADKAAFEKWVRSGRGVPVVYQLEGVVLELENGDEYAVPFFLFSYDDQKLLKGGWDGWLRDQGADESTEDHAFRLQSLAAAYQQDQQINRQIAQMNLNMNMINAGITSAWEVTLYPVPGNPRPPMWVVTMGRNSAIATEIALRQNPGFVSGPVRRVSR